MNDSIVGFFKPNRGYISFCAWILMRTHLFSVYLSITKHPRYVFVYTSKAFFYFPILNTFMQRGISMFKKLLSSFVIASTLLFSQLVFAQEVLVSAAASLSNAFKDIGEVFEKKNPGVKVVFNFAASGVLLRQIEQGAPVDVFASADEATMDKAVKQNLIVDGTRFVFVDNTLVLIVPKGSQKPTKLADLKDKNFASIAIGTPSSVPAGNYTQEVLKKDGLWADLESKFVFGESVRQVLQYVSRKEVDAGFVYATDAAVNAKDVDIALTVPTLSPISYPMAQVKTGEHPELAKKFMDFVASDEGQKILSQYGFSAPQKK